MARSLAKSTVEKFRTELVEERERLQRLIDEHAAEMEEARMSEAASDRSADPDSADAAAMKFEYQKELSLEQNSLDLLHKVERALSRIDEGEYGICESCGQAIPVARLEVLPYSTLCVDCARRL